MRTLITLTAMALVATWSAQGQAMTAMIPFSFTSGELVARAGEYRIEPAHAVAPGVYAVRKDESAEPKFTALPKPMGRAAGENKLVFACDKLGCELVQVWLGGEGHGNPWLKGNREVKLAACRR